MKIADLAREALKEDLFDQDVTTASVDSFLKSRSEALPEIIGFTVVAQEAGVFSGREWAAAVASEAELEIPECWQEGAAFARGDQVLKGRARAASVLSAERTLLNGLQYACGVATRTAEYSQQLDSLWKKNKFTGPVPGLYHTRKSHPLLRDLAVKAVLAGGGQIHRVSLADRVLFKENHKYFVYRQGLRLQDYLQYLQVWGFEGSIIEVETLEEAIECAAAGAQHLLLDNFSPERLNDALARLPSGIEVEVSGGLRLETLGDFALPGVTRLSVGSLTRDVRSVDLSLDWELESETLSG